METGMTGIALWQMLVDLEEHTALPRVDRIALVPAFEARKRDEVVPLPESVINQVHRLHSKLCGPSRAASDAT
jgi:hypothetical protein